jgi:hypothetical protein
MKNVARYLMLVLLATAVVTWTVAPASANTELVPGSRLVYPYIDISTARETFLCVTNAGSHFVPLHVEFYAQNCTKTDQRFDLTAKDLACIQVSSRLSQGSFPAVAGSAVQQNVAGIGWVDMDVRSPVNCPTASNLAGCPSVEYNGLMGMAIILDVAQDWALAYPAAASQGSAEGGFSDTTQIIDGNSVVLPDASIVSRTNQGFPTVWHGAYETYPFAHMIPAFFAEDPCTTPAPVGLSAFIAMVGPGDGWRKEGPGAELGTGVLVSLLQSTPYDGAEHSASISASAHHINGRLCSVFQDAIRTRDEYHDPPGYGSFDIIPAGVFESKNAVGWLEMTNSSLTQSTPTNGPAAIANNAFTSANGFDTSQRARGMVGIIFEIQQGDFLSLGGASGFVKTADVVRSWADPATQIDWGCFNTAGTGGRTPPTQVPGANAPLCTDGGGGQGIPDAVAPDWLCDHAQTNFGLPGGGCLTAD